MWSLKHWKQNILCDNCSEWHESENFLTKIFALKIKNRYICNLFSPHHAHKVHFSVKLGRRQAARQRILVPPSVGSNPAAPAKAVHSCYLSAFTHTFKNVLKRFTWLFLRSACFFCSVAKHHNHRLITRFGTSRFLPKRLCRKKIN